jgi:PhnB protein
MASVSTYLNFNRNTEEAFNFYRSVFGGEFIGGVMRFRDIPSSTEMPPIPDNDKDLVMHVALPITGWHKLMGTDAPESMGFKINQGNNVYLNLEVDTREETKRLFNLLSAGGKIEQELQDMFWGDYYGSCRDRFGVQWMFNCSEKANQLQ